MCRSCRLSCSSPNDPSVVTCCTDRLIVPCVSNLSGLFLDSDKLNHSAASSSEGRAANRRLVYLYSGGKIKKISGIGSFRRDRRFDITRPV